MIDYLYLTSNFNLFIILSGFFIIISIIALFFIKLFMPLHLRYKENAVIGCTSALVIVIYGVLAAFATLYLMNSNNNASDALQREANAIANFYRDSQWLNEPDRANIQTEIKAYLTQVINMEWPLMNRGAEIGNTGDLIIERISNELSHYKISNNTESLAIADMLVVSRNIYDARQQRIQLSYSSLSPEVWVVIIAGTIFTLLVSYLFGINFYLHLFVVIAAALMTSSIIFLLISLDKPFQGDFVIGPGTYKTVLAFINKTG